MSFLTIWFDISNNYRISRRFTRVLGAMNRRLHLICVFERRDQSWCLNCKLRVVGFDKLKTSVYNVGSSSSNYLRSEESGDSLYMAEKPNP